MEQRQNRRDSRARERSAPRDRRSAARLPLIVEVGVKETRFCVQRAALIDISASGCRLHTGFPYKIGQDTAVIIPGFRPFPAQIVWSGEGDIGLRFAKSLHPSVVAHILGKSIPVESLSLCILRSFFGKPEPEQPG